MNETKQSEPTQSQGPRKLYRKPEGKMIAGVAEGLGEYFDVDPLFFRIGFVVTAFFGGAGILAYVLMWWLVPASGPMEGPAERFMERLRGLPRWIAIGLILLGGVLIAGQAGFPPELVWGTALIVFGVVVFRGRPSADAPALLEARPARADGTAPDHASLDAAETLPLTAADPDRRRPWRRRRRERSALGWITTAVTLLAVGFAAMLDNAGAIHLSLAQMLALPLMILGLGLVVGTWWGRARWLLLPAILLAPLVALASLVTVPWTGGYGDRYIQPLEASDVRPVYHLVAGNLTLDLTKLAVSTSEPVRVEATVVAGVIHVIVPPSARVQVRARSELGEVTLFDRGVGGMGVQDEVTRGPGLGRAIFLDLRLSFGRIVVYSYES